MDRPQNGVKSHDLPGSTVAHRVDAKHIPGKSMLKNQTGKTTNYYFAYRLIEINVNVYQFESAH